MELKRLTETPGMHSARFNPSFTRYFDDASDAATPAADATARGGRHSRCG